MIHQHFKQLKSHSSSGDQEAAYGIARGPGGHKAPKEKRKAEDQSKTTSKR